MSAEIPTAAMVRYAINPRHSTKHAENEIRKAFKQKLTLLRGPRVTLDERSEGAPPIAFDFIDECLLQDGVHRADPATMEGCGDFYEGSIACRPHVSLEMVFQ